jgi:hypothetical protein
MPKPNSYHNHPDDGVLREKGRCGTCDDNRPRPPHAIYKYRVGYGRTDLPAVNIAAKVVHFAFQDGEPTIWVEVDKSPWGEHNKSELTVKVFATGEDFDAGPRTDSMRYVGMATNGPFVWHCYQQTGAW